MFDHKTLNIYVPRFLFLSPSGIVGGQLSAVTGVTLFANASGMTDQPGNASDAKLIWPLWFFIKTYQSYKDRKRILETTEGLIC